MKPAGYGQHPPPLSLGPSSAATPPASSGRTLVRSVSDRKAFGPGDQPNSAALPTWGYDFDPGVATRAVAAKARLLEDFESRYWRRLLEASGGIQRDTVRAIAETGVDRISIGSLTKDIRAVDYSLRVI